MNYFFKYLIPQLLDYFNNDVEQIKEFIPDVIMKKYKNEINEYIKIEEVKADETIN